MGEGGAVIEWNAAMVKESGGKSERVFSSVNANPEQRFRPLGCVINLEVVAEQLVEPVVLFLGPLLFRAAGRG